MTPPFVMGMPKVEKPLPQLRAIEGGASSVVAKIAYDGMVYSTHKGEHIGPSGWTLESIDASSGAVEVLRKEGKKTETKRLYLGTPDSQGGASGSGAGLPGLPTLPPVVGGPVQTFSSIPGK
jgi:hypothetical protein